MAAPYKLRCSLAGHEKDVRGVCPVLFPEGGIVSGSRDLTTRLWVPNEGDPGFHEGIVWGGHSNFISAVCFLPPDGTYSHGLIITGSNDHSINAYTLDSPSPVFTMQGHTNTVCTLAAGKFGTILSGSWDKTAKVWLNKKCVMTLQGHEAAVWGVAIMPEQGYMITGSADKTIKIWKAGKCERTLKGHEDCVRSIAVINQNEFVSCSNDATIRHWTLKGDCLEVLYGHENFVYSICVLPGGAGIASVGEDRTLRIWKNGNVVQTIAHPSVSVWSVNVTPDGDIITGSSDAMVRVFTNKPERMASAEEQKAYEDEVAKAEVPAQIGDIQKRDLPGPEALLNPGSKNGQTKMVKNGDKVELYNWDSGESKWNKIGDVVGSSGGTQKTSGKKLYNGKEYDYVFDVALDDDKPGLKLPYNITEDPWFAARRFLEDNEISQTFLDQVANFIMKNTEGMTIGQAQPSVSDPFTGEGRYIPGTAPEHINTSVPSYGADPFTGQGSYRPSGVSEKPVNNYFPQKEYVTFDPVNSAQVLGKVKEFNGKVDVSVQLSEQRIDDMLEVLEGRNATPEHLTTMLQILTWPHEYVFPGLDILRVCIKNRFFNERLCKTDHFVDSRLVYLKPKNTPANQMLTLRTFCNMFVHQFGEVLAMKNIESIITAALDCRLSPNKHIQIAIATLILNYCVFIQDKEVDEAKTQCLLAIASVLENSVDSEAVFRLLVALGTLVKNDETTLMMARSLDLKRLVEPFLAQREPAKVPGCASFLLEIL